MPILTDYDLGRSSPILALTVVVVARDDKLDNMNHYINNNNHNHNHNGIIKIIIIMVSVRTMPTADTLNMTNMTMKIIGTDK